MPVTDCCVTTKTCRTERTTTAVEVCPAKLELWPESEFGEETTGRFDWSRTRLAPVFDRLRAIDPDGSIPAADTAVITGTRAARDHRAVK